MGMAEIQDLFAGAEITYTPRGRKRFSINGNLKRQSELLHVALGNMAKALKDNLYAEAGWTEASGSYPNGEDVARVALFQEYGGTTGTGRTVPPRPFVRPTARAYGRKYINFARRGIIAALKRGNDPKPVMAMLAERVAGDLKKSILAVMEPPLRPMTIAMRRRRWSRAKTDNGYGNILEKPLIDTGRMISSVVTESGTV